VTTFRVVLLIFGSLEIFYVFYRLTALTPDRPAIKSNAHSRC